MSAEVEGTFSRGDALLVGGLLVSCLFAAASTECDPDMFHLLALGRAVSRLGHVPMHDVFAYTPTRSPVVHHEWLFGVVLYPLVATTGATGLLVLKYALHLATFSLALAVAWSRGASLVTLAFLAPMVIGLCASGLTTMRPLVVTLSFVAFTLVCIEVDRRGARWWMLPYVVAHVVWLNVHGGFFVGPVLLALHAIEQTIRRQPVRHIVLLLPVLALCVLVTPYGLAYPRYLARALTMDRSTIGEWRRLGDGFPWALPIWGFTLLVFVTAWLRNDPWRQPGWLLVAVTALAAYRNQRNVSIYAVVWLACVPPMVETSGVGRALRRVWFTRPRLTRALVAAGIVAGLVHATTERHWQVSVPTAPDACATVFYPAGVVDYLRDNGVTGTMVTPFELGAFVSWNLAPSIRVSLDGRYEVAYPISLVAEHVAFYGAGSAWDGFLTRYPSDLVLAKRTDPVVAPMQGAAAWNTAYEDDAFVLFARSTLALPYLDRRGERIAGTFP